MYPWFQKHCHICVLAEGRTWGGFVDIGNPDFWAWPVQKPSLFLKKKESKLPVCSRNAPFCSSVLVVSFWFSSFYYLLWPNSITSSRTLFLHGDICRTRMDKGFFFFVIVQRKIHSPQGSGNLISCTSESAKGGERQSRGKDENKERNER